MDDKQLDDIEARVTEQATFHDEPAAACREALKAIRFLREKNLALSKLAFPVFCEGDLEPQGSSTGGESSKGTDGA